MIVIIIIKLHSVRLTESSQNNIFSITHFNIRSIINKHEDFSCYLASLQHKFSIIGYLKYNTKHGGVIAMYIIELYQFTERNDLSIIMENIIEEKFIEINMPTKNILIGIIYRPLNNTDKQFEDKLSAILQIINQQNKKC